jgi:hypothetical protein
MTYAPETPKFDPTYWERMTYHRDYALLVGREQHLSEHVSRALDKGWELHGSPFSDTGEDTPTRICQAIIKPPYPAQRRNYLIVVNRDELALSIEVCANMADGWLPYGSPFSDSSFTLTRLCQAMVKVIGSSPCYKSPTPKNP